MHQLGHTRSAHHRDHLLQTPDTFVRAPLPGMDKATAIVHVAPPARRAFTQYTAEFEAGGALKPGPLATLRVCARRRNRSFREDAWAPGGSLYLPAGPRARVLRGGIAGARRGDRKAVSAA